MKRSMILLTMVALLASGLAVAQEKPAAPAKPGAPQATRAPRAQGPLGQFREDLKITPEQQAKLQEFQKARQEENKAFAEQMKKVREEMQALRKDGKPDFAKMSPLIDRQFKLQADRAKSQLKNQFDREKIFTPEQLEKMKQARQRLQDRPMAGNRGMMMRGRMMNRPGQMMMRPGMRPGQRFRMGQGQRFGQGMGQMRGRMMSPQLRMGRRGMLRRGPGWGLEWRY
jgi:Spy/CpxP family protein refolding chaperone